MEVNPIVSQYQQLENAFFASSGSKQAAQNLYDFMQSHYQAVLAAMQETGYAPAPQDENAQNNLDALNLFLQGYLAGKINTPDPGYEWCNDVAEWMGIGITPKVIESNFNECLEAFQKFPEHFACDIQWILLPSYAKALSTLAQDPKAFLKAAAAAESAANAYDADPTAANLQKLQACVADLPPL